MSATLVCPGVGTLVLPWWPDTVTRSGNTRNWSETARPGRTPLLLSDGLNLPEYQVSYLVRTRDLSESVADHLALLDAIATSEVPVMLVLEGSNRGLFHLTEVSVSEVSHTTTGEPSSADVSATLKAASDASINIGPVPRKVNKMPEAKKKKNLKSTRGGGRAGR